MVRTVWDPGDQLVHPAEILVLVGVEKVLELCVEHLQVLFNQDLAGKK